MPFLPNVPPPPIPTSQDDQQRFESTRQRERLMSGVWQGDLQRELVAQLGRIRTNATGSSDMSSCLLRSIALQLAVLYDRAPIVTHPFGAEELVGAGGLLESAGLWQLMIGVQQQVIALNEMLMAVAISPDGRPLYRPVSPSYVVAEASVEQPDEPISVRELRLRKHPETGAYVWAWDCWFPRDRHFSVRTAGSTETDVTSLYITTADGVPVSGPLEGDDYPYLNPDGSGILPFGFWHSIRTGRLWNPYLNQEVVSGSLVAAVGYNFWWHCLRDASYPQRYAVSCVIPGLGLEDSDTAPRSSIVTDPSTILMLSQDESESQPMLGQWNPASDPSMLLECLQHYESRIAQYAGISPSDIQRQSGQAQSGYAISLSQNGKREARAKYAPQMERGDSALVGTTAAMLNSVTGSSWPTSGYSVRYAAVPKSPTELDAERRHVLELLEASLIDRADALMMLSPGMTRSEALARLEAIRRLNISTAA